MRKNTAGILAVAGFFCVSGIAFGEEPKSAAPAGEIPGKAAPRMVVVRDPQTGELRPPTAAELEALKPAAPAPKAAIKGQTATVEKLPSGRVRARLGLEYMRWSVVRKNPDGTLSYDCVQDAKVDAALKPSAPATRSAEEK